MFIKPSYPITDHTNTNFNLLDQKKLDNIFFDACEENNIKTIKHLLESNYLSKKPNINTDDYAAFYFAVVYGQKDLIEYYLFSPILKEKIILEDALLAMCNRNYVKIVYLTFLLVEVNLTEKMENAILGLDYKYNIEIKEPLEKILELKRLNKKLNNDLKGNVQNKFKQKI